MRYASVVSALLLALALPLSAQAPGEPLAVSVFGGQSAALTSLDGGTDLDGGAAAGAALSIGIGDSWAVRLSGLWHDGPTESGDALIAGRSGDATLFSAEGVYGLGSLLPVPESIAPYVVAGVGSYARDFDGYETVRGVAYTAGVGAEYRFGRAGIVAEVRDLASDFDHFGHDGLVHDLTYSVGLAFHP